MNELSDRQKRFIAAYLVDFNGTRAAIVAGYSPRSAGTAAKRLMADPAVRAEIDRHQAKVATDASITVKTLIEEAESARVVAEHAGNASAMVSASMLKAKLLGLLADNTEDMLEREKAAAERSRAAEFKTAGALLADAAGSLGLPRDASPAMIVGAIAETPIATPEAFELLRLSRLQKGTA